MSKVEDAMQLFREGRSCARAIRNVYLQPHGLPEDACKAIAQNFAAALDARPLCGAVTGAFAVLAQQQADARPLFADFADRFRARHVHLSCFDLIGCDIGTEAGRKQMREQQLLKTRCIYLVRDAALILEDMLQQNPPEPE